MKKIFLYTLQYKNIPELKLFFDTGVHSEFQPNYIFITYNITKNIIIKKL